MATLDDGRSGVLDAGLDALVAICAACDSAFLARLFAEQAAPRLAFWLKYVRMLGDREMPPKLEVLGGGLHIAVQVGGVANDSLKVTNQGTSLLVWELRQVSGLSTGLHIPARSTAC